MMPAQRYIDFFSHLSPEKLADLPSIFVPHARFKDPFNDVQGIEAIRRVFEHMYATTQDSRFIIQHYAQHEYCLLIAWHYRFKTLKGQAWLIPGTSVVQLNEQGLATEHIDYWDPAEHIYSKVALLGSLMRWLQSRLRA